MRINFKMILCASFGFTVTHFLMAQNIGIGTTTPGARVDIIKPGGDTPAMNIRGSQYISHFHFGIAEDTYIRGGKSTSNVIIADLGSGKVGLGTTSPGFPLNFANALGDKISLFGNNGAHYGLGIQSGQLQIHTDQQSSDILFGYGSSGSFNETMRIKGNGNLGIGVNNPSFKLDIADRMRIRSGGGFSTAGLYLNSNDNSQSPAFIGMDDDSHVGFWGSGIGWKFSMNTQTGALKINGSEGAAGQVITSTGAGVAQWANPTKLLYDNCVMKVMTSPYSALPSTSGTAVELTDLTHTFTLAGNAKVLIRPHLYLDVTTCSCASTLWVDLQLNGVNQAWFTHNMPTGSSYNMSEEWVLQLGAGTYTVRLVVYAAGPIAYIFGSGAYEKSRMIIEIFPQ